MATQIEMVEEEAEPEKVDRLSLFDILTPDVNLADRLDERTLGVIGARVIRDVEIDEQSRSDWLKRYDKSLDIAMQVRKPKTFPWPGSANVKYPLLTVASIQFQARAYPAIVDGSNLVKGRVLGPDPDGQKRARADRIGQHMTWQLLYKMPDWEEDTDQLLLVLPIVGCQFRKTYFDSIENANRSETVSAKDFIINYWAKSLKTAPRYTQVLHYYPYEAKEKIAAGLWREIRIDDTGSDDDEALVDFYEQHRMEDLDGDGFPEPYVVTTNCDGEVARIVPCFGPEDVKVMGGMLAAPVRLSDLLQSGQIPNIELTIVKIERRQYFTKYGFIPAPDGSFYDIGFGTLLEGISSVIDTTINQMLDAGTLQNAGGGFMGSGVTMRGGEFKFRIGEWKRVDSTGGPLRDNILPMPAPGPSAVLFQLLGMLIDAAKEITAVQDVLTGQGTANQPATTTLALIEQGQKVMTGIFKRIHRAFGEELRILRRLNATYLDEQEYFQLSDPQPQIGPDGQPMVGADGKPVMTDGAAVGRQDYADEDLDVIPVSDPGQVSDMQKMAKAEALMQTFNGDPMVNQKRIREDFLQAVGARDIKGYFEVPPPQPDPRVLMEGMKLQLEKLKAEAEIRGKDSAAAKALADASKIMAELGLLDDAAALAGAATELGGDIDDADSGPGAVPGMEGQPPDGGVPAIPEGSPVGLDAGMGAGGLPEPGAAGAGGSVGPSGGDQF